MQKNAKKCICTFFPPPALLLLLPSARCCHMAVVIWMMSNNKRTQSDRALEPLLLPQVLLSLLQSDCRENEDRTIKLPQFEAPHCAGFGKARPNRATARALPH